MSPFSLIKVLCSRFFFFQFFFVWLLFIKIGFLGRRFLGHCFLGLRFLGRRFLDTPPSIVHVLRHNIHNYMKNTTRNTKTSILTVTLLNKIERIKRIVTALTVVPKEAWVPFSFNLLFLHRKRFLSQATPCVPHCENQNHFCHTDYQLHKSCDSQTWYTFFCSNSYRF